VNVVADELTVPFTTANRLVGRLQQLGVLHEITGHARNRVFQYSAYLALFA
jgi:hypothetical protein